MVKKILLCIFACTWMMQSALAKNGLFFNVLASGTPGEVEFILCLNGRGPVSCQNYSAAFLSLTFIPNIPNHVYPEVGIKLKTSGLTLSGCTPSPNGYCLFSASQASPGSVGVSSLSYPLVTVGDPGNSNDILTGFGAVAYSFKIGKYLVSIAQYTAFLNAVATTDTYGLYNPAMATDLNSAGILRSGNPGSYTYTVITNGGSSANRPITYVSWFNAARYANWMANGQPSGQQNNTTTEDGVYSLHGITNGNAIVKNLINPNTNAAPTYYIPLENEWYKAAYYSTNIGGVPGYYEYATQSNVMPGNEVGSKSNQANFFTVKFSVTQSPDYLSLQTNYLTDVGAFTASPSFYGTYDQSGNVWEWNDLTGTSGPSRGLRGGFWFSGSVPLQSLLFSTDSPTRADSGIGFRLASPV